MDDYAIPPPHSPSEESLANGLLGHREGAFPIVGLAVDTFLQRDLKVAREDTNYNQRQLPLSDASQNDVAHIGREFRSFKKMNSGSRWMI